MTTHLLRLSALTQEEFISWCELSRRPAERTFLKGQGVALIFERPSLRTRAACVAAINELGGYVASFTGDEVGIDTRESAEDVARMIAELFPMTAWRVKRHEVLERAVQATDGRLAMINLLSEQAHPTQAIADVLTLADHFGAGALSSLAGRHVTYLGDATNVAKSLAVACVRLGCSVTIAAPAGYQVDDDFAARTRLLAQQGASLTLSDDPEASLRHAEAIYTDAFVSMGAEAEHDKRLRDLAAFRLDEDLLAAAPAQAVVLHCLPAHRGEEITDEVLDSDRSLVWRQAAHRKSAMVGALYMVGGAQ
jgi:ornithine carbamoyltransferase